MGEAERPMTDVYLSSPIRPRASPPPFGRVGGRGQASRASPPPPGRVGGRRDRSGGAGIAPERLTHQHEPARISGGAGTAPEHLSLLPAPPGSHTQICVMQKPGKKCRIICTALPLPGMGGFLGSNTILPKFVSCKNTVKNTGLYARRSRWHTLGFLGSNLPTHTNYRFFHQCGNHIPARLSKIYSESPESSRTNRACLILRLATIKSRQASM